MQFREKQEYTFNDAFLFQQVSDVKSRTECSINPIVKGFNRMLNSSTPFISANMNAVSGKRMAEAMAIYGGLASLPQDMSKEKKEEVLQYLSANAKASFNLLQPVIVYDKMDNVIVAKQLSKKKSINAVFVASKDGIVGYYTKEMLDKYPESEKIDITTMPTKPIMLINEPFNANKIENYYQAMIESNNEFCVFVEGKENEQIFAGVLTKKHALRFEDYQATLNPTTQGLDVILSYGVNQLLKEEAIIEEIKYFNATYGVNQFLVDTAHWTQVSVSDAVFKLRELLPHSVIIAGNVCTAEWTRRLIEAGADGIKVGIWPWAMCETRMQTGVGRPQLSAIMECAEEANKLGAWIIADGGIKTPRDACLALAAGASYVMMGTLLAGTLESVAEIKFDLDGNPYKQNFGMASGLAVKERNQHLTAYQQARRMRFQEGISTSMIYIKPKTETVGDVIDMFATGLQSSMSYTGARNLKEFLEKAIIGVQTASGYTEGTPHGRQVK